MMTATLRPTTFANTFLVSRDGHAGPVFNVVGPEETRKKRPHRKSRLGCIRCKRRKVKCDEGDPCRNCVKRKETCVRDGPTLPNNVNGDGGSKSPRQVYCPLPEPECGPVNLLHMELLHHFERHTIHTLPFHVVWPRMLQLAFQSRQHTYLVNAMLSLSAAHLDYLHRGDNPRYHRAKYALLDKALHDYREALSAPITADNCDALLGTANLIQFLMWSDVSFMDGQQQGQQQPLDLSGDRLYWLCTGVRQILFMAWPLFQTPQSVFVQVGMLQPCMALEDVVEARGLNWQRYVRALMQLYDNPRYRGGRGAFPSPSSLTTAQPCPFSRDHDEGHAEVWTLPSPLPPSQSSERYSTPSCSSPPSYSTPTTTTSSSSSPSSNNSNTNASTNANGNGSAYLEGLIPSLASSSAPPYKVMTLWQSYKEGEAYVKSAGQPDEALTRAAYGRLAARLAVAMAFVVSSSSSSSPSSEEDATSTSTGNRQQQQYHPEAKRSDMVRYVTVFPMMCFGPLLALISTGDSRMLVVLFHIYRVVGQLLPGETYWWCRRRVMVMEEAIGRELRSRGLEVCLRRQNEVA